MDLGPSISIERQQPAETAETAEGEEEIELEVPDAVINEVTCEPEQLSIMDQFYVAAGHVRRYLFSVQDNIEKLHNHDLSDHHKKAGEDACAALAAAQSKMKEIATNLLHKNEGSYLTRRQTAAQLKIAVQQADQDLNKAQLVIEEEKTGPTLEIVQAAVFRTLRGGVIAVTSKGRRDGMGAQALGKITTRVMAEALGLRYVHLPFESLTHCDPGFSQKRWDLLWEKLLGIGNDAPSLRTFPNIKHIDNKDVPRTLRTYPFKVGWAYAFRDVHTFTDILHDELEAAWGSVINGLRTRYAGNRELPFDLTEDKNIVHVAVHIRRGDAGQAASRSRRWLNNSYYRNVMVDLDHHADKSGVKCIYHIVSEGDRSSFEDLEAAFPGRVTMHLSLPSSDRDVGTRSRRGAGAQTAFPRRRSALLEAKQQPLGDGRRAGAVGGMRAQCQQQRIRRRAVKVAEKEAGRSETPALATDEAFQMLVSADVLIMSRSAFSYLAALYSKGAKLLPPGMWWDVPAWCDLVEMPASDDIPEDELDTDSTLRDHPDCQRNDVWARVTEGKNTVRTQDAGALQRRLGTFL